MARPELLIFDFDGTLVDTAPDIIRATNFYLESQGFDALSEERIRLGIGMGLRQLMVNVWPDEQIKDEEFSRKVEGEFLKVYEREFLTSPKLYDGALDFLSEWEGQLAIVSNKRTRFIHPILEKLALQSLPWVRVIGGDTYAEMKPHPRPFLGAVETAGVSPEDTWVIGDGIPDVEGALAADIRCVAVDFGYTPASELMDLGAWKSIASFAELMPLIAAADEH